MLSKDFEADALARFVRIQDAESLGGGRGGPVANLQQDVSALEFEGRAGGRPHYQEARAGSEVLAKIGIQAHHIHVHASPLDVDDEVLWNLGDLEAAQVWNAGDVLVHENSHVPVVEGAGGDGGGVDYLAAAVLDGCFVALLELARHAQQPRGGGRFVGTGFRVGSRKLFPVETHDDVVGFEAGLVGGSAGGDGFDHGTHGVRVRVLVGLEDDAQTRPAAQGGQDPLGAGFGLPGRLLVLGGLALGALCFGAGPAGLLLGPLHILLGKNLVA